MTRPKKDVSRCHWAKSPLMIEYHDKEWGVPVHDDRGLFEFLILEGAQAGLSWATILNKRENYREAFDRFDAKKIARYDARKAARADGQCRHRAQPPENRRNDQQRPGVSGRAEGIRQLRHVHLEFRGGKPGKAGAGSRAARTARIRRHEQGS